jgi:hypothetical protein
MVDKVIFARGGDAMCKTSLITGFLRDLRTECLQVGKTRRFFRLCFFSLIPLCFSSGVAQPNAPIIFKISALSSSAVQISWRDNSTDEKGFIVYHRQSGDTVYNAGDTIGPNSTQCVDSGLSPSTKYVFVVKAYNDGGMSEASNADSATTLVYIPPPPPPLFTPSFTFLVDSASGRVTLCIHDSNTTEKGYLIERGTTDSQLTVMDSMLSSQPADTGKILWTDSSAGVRTRLWYRVSAFNSDSLKQSPVSWVFSYLAPQLDSVPMRVISTFSLHYAGWAVLQGDTLFSKEKIGTDTVISLVSLKDPLHPTYLGTADSVLLKRYSSTLVATAKWNRAQTNFADEPILEYPYIYAIIDGCVTIHNYDTASSSFQSSGNLIRCETMDYFVHFYNIHLFGNYIVGAIWEAEDRGPEGRSVILINKYTKERSAGWALDGLTIGTKIGFIADSSYAVSWGFDYNHVGPGSGPWYSCRVNKILSDPHPLLNINTIVTTDSMNHDSLQQPILLRYPYVFWCDGSAVKATNMWQAGTQTVLGSVRPGFTLYKFVIDEKRNYIIALGVDQMSVISVGANLCRHPFVNPIQLQPSCEPQPLHSIGFRFSNGRIIVNGEVQTGARLVIYNAIGRRVAAWSATGRKTFFDVHWLPAGVYIARLTAGTNNYSRTICVNR